MGLLCEALAIRLKQVVRQHRSMSQAYELAGVVEWAWNKTLCSFTLNTNPLRRSQIRAIPTENNSDEHSEGDDP